MVLFSLAVAAKELFYRGSAVTAVCVGLLLVGPAVGGLSDSQHPPIYSLPFDFTLCLCLELYCRKEPADHVLT